MSTNNLETNAGENDRKQDADNTSDPIQEAMGDFGRWHLLIVVSLSMVSFSVAWHQWSIAFLAPETRFECTHYNGHNDIDRRIDHRMKCEILKDNHTHKCDQFQYNRSTFENSIITKWNLVCSKKSLGTIVQPVTIFGISIGNMIFGIIADRIGRKTPLVIAVLLQSLAGLVSAFAPWYELFLVLEFVAAIATGGAMLTSFVLMIEIVGAKRRPVCSVLFHVPFILGQMISALISYLTRTWTGYQIAISLPPILLLCYYWIIPESPRWLLAVGRVDEAEEILKKISKRNKIDLDKVRIAIEAHELQWKNSNDIENSTKVYNITDLFKTPNLRMKTICICVNWFICGICFFGLVQFDRNLDGDVFLITVLLAVLELPGLSVVFFLISRVSRLKIFIGGNLLCGSSLLIWAIIAGNDIAYIILKTLGLIGMCVSFPIVYLYSSEVFPTVVRSVGLGLASFCARIGSMVAPFVSDLQFVRLWLPPLLFCIGPLLGAGLCYFLPETFGCDLPETIEDGENFGKKRRSSQTNA